MLKAMSSSSSAFIWGKWLRESFIGRYYTHRRQRDNRIFGVNDGRGEFLLVGYIPPYSLNFCGFLTSNDGVRNDKGGGNYRGGNDEKFCW